MPPFPRGAARKTSPRRIDAATRADNAVRMRAAGRTDAEIAEALGYKNATYVRKVIRETLRDRSKDAVDELRKLEETKMDLLERAGFEGIASGDLENIPRIVSVMGRRAKLLGLDADRTGNDFSTVDQWLQGVAHIAADDIEDLTEDELAEFANDGMDDEDGDLGDDEDE